MFHRFRLVLAIAHYDYAHVRIGVALMSTDNSQNCHLGKVKE